MSNLNRVIITGNLTRDPEFRQVNGHDLCTFSVANNQWEGESRGDVAHFFDVTCWGKRAATIQKYFAKGKKITVEGRLKQQVWETKEGQKRSKVYINLENFEFHEKVQRDQAPDPVPDGLGTEVDAPKFDDIENPFSDEGLPF